MREATKRIVKEDAHSADLQGVWRIWESRIVRMGKRTAVQVVLPMETGSLSQLRKFEGALFSSRRAGLVVGYCKYT